MATRSLVLIRLLQGALVVLVVLAYPAWVFLDIQLRLARNGAIATQLVESLRAQFPRADFGGAASYEKEVVYITVLRGLERARLQEVAQWLRNRKDEQGIAPAIWLRFEHEADYEKTIRIE